MPFCPECLSEYKAGITRCDDCNRDLVDKLENENMIHDRSDAKMVELRTFANTAEAEMVQEVLEQHDIRMLLQGEEATGGLFPTPATGVNLLVDERDVARAQELIDAYFNAEIVEGELVEETEKGNEKGNG